MDSRGYTYDNWEDRGRQKEARRKKLSLQNDDKVIDYFRCPECGRFCDSTEESPDGDCFDCFEKDGCKDPDSEL